MQVDGTIKATDLEVSATITANKFVGEVDGLADSLKAIKTYVDNKVGGIPSSQWSDTTTELGKAIYYNNGDVGIGTNDPTAKLEVVGNLKLETGVVVNQFSSDTNLGDSNQAVPTQKAVKTYVDNITVTTPKTANLAVVR